VPGKIHTASMSVVSLFSHQLHWIKFILITPFYFIGEGKIIKKYWSTIKITHLWYSHIIKAFLLNILRHLLTIFLCVFLSILSINGFDFHHNYNLIFSIKKLNAFN
jgi:hypothetical protein